MARLEEWGTNCWLACTQPKLLSRQPYARVYFIPPVRDYEFGFRIGSSRKPELLPPPPVLGPRPGATLAFGGGGGGSHPTKAQILWYSGYYSSFWQGLYQP